MILESGANTIIVTLNELKTLTTPDYVLVLQNRTTNRISCCKIGTDLSSYPERYNKFTLTVKSNPNDQNAEVDLDESKEHDYYIYETEDASTITVSDVRDLTGVVEQGTAFYVTSTTDPSYYKDVPDRRYAEN